MPSFNPQNIRQRFDAVGRSATDARNSIQSNLQNSANVLTNGIRSSVEGSVNELKSAITQPFRAIDNLFSGLTNIFGGGSKGGGGYTNIRGGDSGGTSDQITPSGVSYSGGPIKNPLKEFASVNYIWTLGILTAEQANFPDSTYRQNGIDLVVLRSGGSGKNQVKTLFEKELGITAEYFIEDVEVEALIAPAQSTKQSNATSFNFKVLEPYSMGIFLQTLMETALKAKYKNYIDACYALQLDFVGWDDYGTPHQVPGTRRIFPLKFSNITFNVTEGGSEYTVEAIPWNEVAFADDIQTTKTTTDIQGSTIAELLQTGPQSLTAILNRRERDLVSAGNKTVANEYIIMFPTTRTSAQEGATGASPQTNGATTQSTVGEPGISASNQAAPASNEFVQSVQTGDVPADFDAAAAASSSGVVRKGNIAASFREYAENPQTINNIGKGQIVKDYLDSGDKIFGGPAFAKGTAEGTFTRGSITISDNARRINFKTGTRIQDMIEEVVILSSYGRQFATDPANDRGMKKWFRIETDVYLINDTANSDQTGSYGKVFVYRVLPYEVNVSRLNAPSQPTPGTENLRRQAMKEYNYIYTGLNDDIINFNIELNYAFFTSIQSDYGQGTSSQVTGSSGNLTNQSSNSVYGQNQGRSDSFSTSGNTRVAQSIGSNTGGQGSGNVEQHPESEIARNFNDAIVNSNVDLVMAEMDIWGDPYYFSDSGYGNYSAAGGQSTNITADGSMDYQFGEVDVLVNFRTPLDYGDDGNMIFPSVGSKPVGQFSGLYQVTMVRNKFSGGQFTQMLTMLRRRNQEGVDTQAPAVSTNTTTVTERGQDASVVRSPNQAAGVFVGPTGSAGGTGGTSANGSNAGSPTADNSGAGDSAAAQNTAAVRGTVGYGEGQVDPRLNQAATANERRRIENVQQARANGANVGF